MGKFVQYINAQPENRNVALFYTYLAEETYLVFPIILANVTWGEGGHGWAIKYCCT